MPRLLRASLRSVIPKNVRAGMQVTTSRTIWTTIGTGINVALARGWPKGGSAVQAGRAQCTRNVALFIFQPPRALRWLAVMQEGGFEGRQAHFERFPRDHVTGMLL